MPAAVLGLALFLRLHEVVRSYDLFIDEVTYADISHNLATGHGLTLHGQAFTLHPPVMFALMASVIKIFHLDGSPQHIIFSLRDFTSVLGALVVLLSYALMRELKVNRWAAVAAAALIAVDPLEVSFDSRVMLESGSQLAVVASMLALASLSMRPWTGRKRAVVVALAGLSAGLALSSKETFGLVLVLTLLVLLACGRPLPRLTIATVLGLAATVYLVCAGAVVTHYGFSIWWAQRTDGLARLLGSRQSTGFNAATTQVTLGSRVVADLGLYAGTYGALALGGIAAVVILLKSRPWRQTSMQSHRLSPDGAATSPAFVLLPVWAMSACAYLAYATLFGSIEEQMYYIPLVPCVLVVIVWLTTWPRAIGHRFAVPAVASLALVPLLFDGFVWAGVHTTDNNAYRHFLQWESANVPRGSRMALTEYRAQFLVKNADLGQWSTMAEIKAHDVDYVLLQTKLVEQGYGLARPGLLVKLREQAPIVFRAASPTDGGELLVFDVRPITGGSKK